MMAQQYTHLSEAEDHMREGASPDYEILEHEMKERMMRAPFLSAETDKAKHPAETGLVDVVKPEGRDNGDAQDASLTTDETRSAAEADAKTTEKAEVDAKTEPEAPKTDKTPTVLIVEDNAELAEIIQATLERKKMITMVESHGNRAIARFKEMKPDVVLLDIGLPDMTGWHIMDTLKEHYKEAGVPKIIIITAYDDPANRLVGKLQGVQAYVIKPFSADEIERVVMQAIGSSSSTA